MIILSLPTKELFRTLTNPMFWYAVNNWTSLCRNFIYQSTNTL